MLVGFFICFCVLIARSVFRLSQPLSRFPRWLATFLRQGIGRPRHAYIKAKLAGVGDVVESLDERGGRSAPSRLLQLSCVKVSEGHVMRTSQQS